MSIEAIGYILTATAIGVTMVAVKIPFGLIKMGAAVAWLALFAFALKNFTQGDEYQVIFILGLVATISALLLLQAGRNVTRSRSDNAGYSIESQGFRFGKWDRDFDQADNRPRAMTTQEYEDRMRRAIGGDQGNRKRLR